MTLPTRSAIVLQLCLLSLLSAFLLFQVQPIISKFILPWFGGSPGVWTTCVLFFQIVLFTGYAYAHGLTRLSRKWQAYIHIVLLLGAGACLPISPGAQWKPLGGEEPVERILLLLLANVGLPYFVLSSTSPLVQVWFGRASLGSSPWRLYALSNLGSLVALVSYPFFFEPRWDVRQQTWMWSGAFLAFIALSLRAIHRDWQQWKGTVDCNHYVNKQNEAPDARPEWWRRTLWLLLPAIASVLLLASTSHLCQDVAVIPFLWVLPLSLYLLTFIICFEHERWYMRASSATLAMAFLFAAAAPMEFASITTRSLSPVLSHDISWDITLDFRWQIIFVCGATFLGCMVCHGELARLKPHTSRLTEFYLITSGGSALGGLCVSLVAPKLFSTHMEWPGVLLATFVIACVVAIKTTAQTKQRWRRTLIAMPLAGIGIWRFTIHQIEGKSVTGGLESLLQPYSWQVITPVSLVFVISFVAILVVVLARENWSRFAAEACAVAFATIGLLYLARNIFYTPTQLEVVRNFYGIISVQDEYDVMGKGWRNLYSGRILHGCQILDQRWRNQPTSYYGRSSGIGRALLTLENQPNARVGVVGIGAGTVAAYGKGGQVYRFYDINSEVVRFSREHFHFLGDLEKRGATVDVVLGDARLSLERESPQHFDVLLLDAFSGDSVPVHLLTREAFIIYQKHLKADGIIAVHISNRYLDLAPVVHQVASSLGMKSVELISLKDAKRLIQSTDYVMVTNNEAFLKAHTPKGAARQESDSANLWTDSCNNLFECLQIPN